MTTLFDVTSLVTSTNTATLTNKTLTDPILTLSATEGITGQALISQGTGVAPVWGDVSAGETTFVATGAISAAGLAVAINADGTVSVISGTDSSAGTAEVFESASTSQISATYDSTNGKLVIAYQDGGNSLYGTAIVGTVSGTSISFGTAVVFESAATSQISATYDSTNGKVVIAYYDGGNSNYGTAIVGTVSGTSISFGTPVVFESAATAYCSAVYDSTNGKVVIAYTDQGNSSYGTAIVGTVSGTSISFGTAVVFESATTYYCSATYDSTSGKVVILYQDAGNSNYGTAIVGTVSGTSISFGTAVVFSSANTQYFSAADDSTNGKVVIAYQDNANSNYGTAIVGTVSGTSISFGTAVVFESATTNEYSAAYDSTNGKVVIAYKDYGNSLYGTAVSGTVRNSGLFGDYMQFDTPIVFESAQSAYLSATYDSTNGKVVIAYQDVGNSNYGTSVVFTVGVSNNLDTIGIAQESVTTGNPVVVKLPYQIDANQTGLTAGSNYYIAGDGTVSTDDTGFLLGRAISATELLITNWGE